MEFNIQETRNPVTPSIADSDDKKEGFTTFDLLIEVVRGKKDEREKPLIDKPMIRNSLICKLINVQASMKENKEKTTIDWIINW